MVDSNDIVSKLVCQMVHVFLGDDKIARAQRHTHACVLTQSVNFIHLQKTLIYKVSA